MGNNSSKNTEKFVQKFPLMLQKQALQNVQDEIVNSERVYEYDDKVRVDFSFTQQSEVLKDDKMNYSIDFLQSETQIFQNTERNETLTETQTLTKSQTRSKKIHKKNVFMHDQYQQEGIPESGYYYEFLTAKKDKNAQKKALDGDEEYEEEIGNKKPLLNERYNYGDQQQFKKKDPFKKIYYMFSHSSEEEKRETIGQMEKTVKERRKFIIDSQLRKKERLEYVQGVLEIKDPLNLERFQLFMDYLFEHLMDEIKKNTIKRKIDLDKFLQKYTKPLEPSFIQTKAAEQANIEKNLSEWKQFTQEEIELQISKRYYKINQFLVKYAQNTDNGATPTPNGENIDNVDLTFHQKLLKILLFYEDHIGNSLLFYLLFDPNEYQEGALEYITQSYFPIADQSQYEDMVQTILKDYKQQKMEEICKKKYQRHEAYSKFLIQQLETDFSALYQETEFKRKVKEKEEEGIFKDLQKRGKNKHNNNEIQEEKKDKLYPQRGGYRVGYMDYAADNRQQYKLGKKDIEQQQQEKEYLEGMLNKYLGDYYSEYTRTFLVPKLVPIKRYKDQKGVVQLEFEFEKLEFLEENDKKKYRGKMVNEQFCTEYMKQYKDIPSNNQKTTKNKKKTQIQTQKTFQYTEEKTSCCAMICGGNNNNNNNNNNKNNQNNAKKKVQGAKTNENTSRYEFLGDVWIEKKVEQDLQDSIYKILEERQIQLQAQLELQNEDQGSANQNQQEQQEKSQQEQKEIDNLIQNHPTYKNLLKNKPKDRHSIYKFFQMHEDQAKLRKNDFQKYKKMKQLSEQKKEEMMIASEVSFQKHLDLYYGAIKETYAALVNNEKLSEVQQDIYRNALQIMAYEQSKNGLYEKLKGIIEEKREQEKNRKDIQDIKNQQQQLVDNVDTSGFTDLIKEIEQAYIASTASRVSEKEFLQKNGYKFHLDSTSQKSTAGQQQQGLNQSRKGNSSSQGKAASKGNSFFEKFKVFFEILDENIKFEDVNNQNQLFLARQFQKGFLNMSKNVKIGEINGVISFLENCKRTQFLKDILEYIFKGNFECKNSEDRKMLVYQKEKQPNSQLEIEENNSPYYGLYDNNFENSDGAYDELDFRHPYLLLQNISFLNTNKYEERISDHQAYFLRFLLKFLEEDLEIPVSQSSLIQAIYNILRYYQILKQKERPILPKKFDKNQDVPPNLEELEDQHILELPYEISQNFLCIFNFDDKSVENKSYEKVLRQERYNLYQEEVALQKDDYMYHQFVKQNKRKPFKEMPYNYLHFCLSQPQNEQILHEVTNNLDTILDIDSGSYFLAQNPQMESPGLLLFKILMFQDLQKYTSILETRYSITYDLQSQRNIKGENMLHYLAMNKKLNCQQKIQIIEKIQTKLTKNFKSELILQYNNDLKIPVVLFIEHTQQVSQQLLQILSPSKLVLNDKIFSIFAQQQDNYEFGDLLCYLQSTKLKQNPVNLSEIDQRYHCIQNYRFQKFLSHFIAYHNKILLSVLKKSEKETKIILSYYITENNLQIYYQAYMFENLLFAGGYPGISVMELLSQKGFTPCQQELFGETFKKKQVKLSGKLKQICEIDGFLTEKKSFNTLDAPLTYLLKKDVIKAKQQLILKYVISYLEKLNKDELKEVMLMNCVCKSVEGVTFKKNIHKILAVMTQNNQVQFIQTNKNVLLEVLNSFAMKYQGLQNGMQSKKNIKINHKMEVRYDNTFKKLKFLVNFELDDLVYVGNGEWRFSGRGNEDKNGNFTIKKGVLKTEESISFIKEYQTRNSDQFKYEGQYSKDLQMYTGVYVKKDNEQQEESLYFQIGAFQDFQDKYYQMVDKEDPQQALIDIFKGKKNLQNLALYQKMIENLGEFDILKMLQFLQDGKKKEKLNQIFEFFIKKNIQNLVLQKFEDYYKMLEQEDEYKEVFEIFIKKLALYLFYNLSELKLTKAKQDLVFESIGKLDKRMKKMNYMKGEEELVGININFLGLPVSTVQKCEENIIDLFLMGFYVKLPNLTQSNAQKIKSEIVRKMCTTEVSFEKIIFSDDKFSVYCQNYLRYHQNIDDYSTLLRYALINNSGQNLGKIQEFANKKEDSQQFFSDFLRENKTILFMFNNSYYHKEIRDNWQKYQQEFSSKFDLNFQLVMKYFGDHITRFEQNLVDKQAIFDRENEQNDKEKDNDSEADGSVPDEKEFRLKRNSSQQENGGEDDPYLDEKRLKIFEKKSLFVKNNVDKKEEEELQNQSSTVKNINYYSHFLVLAMKYLSVEAFQKIPEQYFFELFTNKFKVVQKGFSILMDQQAGVINSQRKFKEENAGPKVLMIFKHFVAYLRKLQGKKEIKDLKDPYEQQQKKLEILKKFQEQLEIQLQFMINYQFYQNFEEAINLYLQLNPVNISYGQLYSQKFDFEIPFHIDLQSNKFEITCQSEQHENKTLKISGEMSKYRQILNLNIFNPEREKIMEFQGESSNRELYDCKKKKNLNCKKLEEYLGVIEEKNDYNYGAFRVPTYDSDGEEEDFEDEDDMGRPVARFEVYIYNSQETLCQSVYKCLKQLVLTDSIVSQNQTQIGLALKMIEKFKIYFNQPQIKGLYLHFLKNPVPQILQKLMAVFSIESQKISDVCGLSRFVQQLSLERNLNLHYYQSAYKLYYPHSMGDSIFQKIVQENSEYLINERNENNDLEFYALCQKGFSQNLKDYVDIVVKKQKTEMQIHKLTKGLKEMCICYQEYQLNLLKNQNTVQERIEKMDQENKSKKVYQIKEASQEEITKFKEKNVCIEGFRAEQPVLNSYSLEEIAKIYNADFKNKEEKEAFLQRYHSDYLQIARGNMKELFSRYPQIKGFSQPYILLGYESVFNNKEKTLDFEQSVEILVQELENLYKQHSSLIQNNEDLVQHIKYLFEQLPRVSVKFTLKLLPSAVQILKEKKQTLIMIVLYQIFNSWLTNPLEWEPTEEFFTKYFIQENIPDYNKDLYHLFAEGLEKMANLKKYLYQSSKTKQRKMMRTSIMFLKQLTSFDKPTKNKLRIRDAHLLGILTNIMLEEHMDKDLPLLISTITNRNKRKKYHTLKYKKTDFFNEDNNNDDQMFFGGNPCLELVRVKGSLLDTRSVLSRLYCSDFFEQLSRRKCDPYIFGNKSEAILFYTSTNNLYMLKKSFEGYKDELKKEEEEAKKREKRHLKSLRKNYGIPGSLDSLNSLDNLDNINNNNASPTRNRQSQFHPDSGPNSPAVSQQNTDRRRDHSPGQSGILSVQNLGNMNESQIEEDIFLYLLKNIHTHNQIFQYLKDILFKQNFEEFFVKSLHAQKLGYANERVLLGCMNMYFDKYKIFSKFLEKSFFQNLKLKDFTQFLEILLAKKYERVFVRIMELIKRDACDNNIDKFKYLPGVLLNYSAKQLIRASNLYQVASFLVQNEAQFQISHYYEEIRFGKIFEDESQKQQQTQQNMENSRQFLEEIEYLDLWMKNYGPSGEKLLESYQNFTSVFYPKKYNGINQIKILTIDPTLSDHIQIICVDLAIDSIESQSTAQYKGSVYLLPLNNKENAKKIGVIVDRKVAKEEQKFYMFQCDHCKSSLAFGKYFQDDFDDMRICPQCYIIDLPKSKTQYYEQKDARENYIDGGDDEDGDDLDEDEEITYPESNVANLIFEQQTLVLFQGQELKSLKAEIQKKKENSCYSLNLMENYVKFKENSVYLQIFEQEKKSEMSSDYKYQQYFQDQIELFYLVLEYLNFNVKEIEHVVQIVNILEYQIFKYFMNSHFDYVETLQFMKKTYNIDILIFLRYELIGYIDEKSIMFENQILQFYFLRRFRVNDKPLFQKDPWEYCLELGKYKDDPLVQFIGSEKFQRLLKSLKVQHHVSFTQDFYNVDNYKARIIEKYLKEYLTSQTGQQSPDVVRYLISEIPDIFQQMKNDQEDPKFTFEILMNDKLNMQLMLNQLVYKQKSSNKNDHLFADFGLNALVREHVGEQQGKVTGFDFSSSDSLSELIRMFTDEEESLTTKHKIAKVLFIVFTSFDLKFLEKLAVIENLEVPQLDIQTGLKQKENIALKEKISFKKVENDSLGKLFIWIIMQMKTSCFNINWIFQFSDIRKFLRNIMRIQLFNDFPSFGVDLASISVNIKPFWAACLDVFTQTCELTESGRFAGKTEESKEGKSVSLESELDFDLQNIGEFIQNLINFVYKKVNNYNYTVIYAQLMNLIITAFEQMAFVDYYLDNFKQKKVTPKLFLQDKKEPEKAKCDLKKLKDSVIEIQIFFTIQQKSKLQECILVGNFENFHPSNPENMQMEIENFFFAENQNWYIKENLKALKHPYSDMDKSIDQYRNFTYHFDFSQKFQALPYQQKNALIDYQIFKGNKSVQNERFFHLPKLLKQIADLYMEYEKELTYDPHLHYDAKPFAEAFKHVQDKYEPREERKENKAFKYLLFRYQKLTLQEFVKICPFYGQKSGENGLEKLEKDEKIEKIFEGWLEILQEVEENEEEEDKGQTGLNIQSKNSIQDEEQKQNSQKQVKSRVSLKGVEDLEVQKKMKIIKRSIGMNLSVDSQGKFEHKHSSEKEEDAAYTFKGYCKDGQFTFLFEFELEKICYVYQSSHCDQNTYQGKGFMMQEGKKQDDNNNENEKGSYAVIQEQIEGQTFNIAQFKDIYSVNLKFLMKFETFEMRNIEIKYLPYEEYQKVTDQEALFYKVMENILMYENYSQRIREDSSLQKDSTQEHNLHLDWFFTLAPCKENFEPENQNNKKKKKEIVHDLVQTRLELFPLYNILQIQVMLKRLVNNIDRQFNSKPLKWRINTQSFVEVLVNNIYQNVKDHQQTLNNILTQNESKISEKEKQLLNILLTQFYGNGFFGIVKAITETRLLSIILQKIIYENLHLWQKPLRAMYVEFKKVDSVNETIFIEHDLKKFLPKGLDKLFRFSKTEYFLQDRVLIIRLNVAFVKGDLLSGDIENYVGQDLKAQSPSELSETHAKKPIRKQIIPESHKVTKDQYYSLFKENEVIKQYIDQVVDAEGLKQQLVERKIVTDQSYLKIQQFIDTSFQTLQQKYDNHRFIQKTIRQAIQKTNALFVQKASYHHCKLNIKIELFEELEKKKAHHLATIEDNIVKIMGQITDAVSRIVSVQKSDRQSRQFLQLLNEDFTNEGNSFSYVMCSLFFKYIENMDIKFQLDRQYSEDHVNKVIVNLPEKKVTINLFLTEFNQKVRYIQAFDIANCIRKVLYINEKAFVTQKILDINESSRDQKKAYVMDNRAKFANQNLETVMFLVKPLQINLDFDQIEQQLMENEGKQQKKKSYIFENDYAMLYLSLIDHLIYHFNLAYISLYDDMKKSKKRSLYDSIQYLSIQVLKDGPATWKKKTSYSFSYYPLKEEFQVTLILNVFQITTILPTFQDILLHFNTSYKNLRLDPAQQQIASVNLKDLIQYWSSQKNQVDLDIQVDLKLLKGKSPDFNFILQQENWDLIVIDGRVQETLKAEMTEKGKQIKDNLINLKFSVQGNIQDLRSGRFMFILYFKKQLYVSHNYFYAFDEYFAVKEEIPIGIKQKISDFEQQQENKFQLSLLPNQKKSFSFFIDNQFQDPLNKEEVQLQNSIQKHEKYQKEEQNLKNQIQFLDQEGVAQINKKYNLVFKETDLQERESNVDVIFGTYFKAYQMELMTHKVFNIKEELKEKQNASKLKQSGAQENKFVELQKKKVKWAKRKIVFFKYVVAKSMADLPETKLNAKGQHEKEQTSLDTYKKDSDEQFNQFNEVQKEIDKVVKPRQDMQDKIEKVKDELKELETMQKQDKNAYDKQDRELYTQFNQKEISESSYKQEKQELKNNFKVKNQAIETNIQKNTTLLEDLKKNYDVDLKLAQKNNDLIKAEQKQGKIMVSIKHIQTKIREIMEKYFNLTTSNARMIKKLTSDIKKDNVDKQEDIEKLNKKQFRMEALCKVLKNIEKFENDAYQAAQDFQSYKEEVVMYQDQMRDIFIHGEEKKLLEVRYKFSQVQQAVAQSQKQSFSEIVKIQENYLKSLQEDEDDFRDGDYHDFKSHANGQIMRSMDQGGWNVQFEHEEIEDSVKAVQGSDFDSFKEIYQTLFKRNNEDEPLWFNDFKPQIGARASRQFTEKFVDDMKGNDSFFENIELWRSVIKRQKEILKSIQHVTVSYDYYGNIDVKGTVKRDDQQKNQANTVMLADLQAPLPNEAKLQYKFNTQWVSRNVLMVNVESAPGHSVSFTVPESQRGQDQLLKYQKEINFTFSKQYSHPNFGKKINMAYLTGIQMVSDAKNNKPFNVSFGKIDQEDPEQIQKRDQRLEQLLQIKTDQQSELLKQQKEEQLKKMNSITNIDQLIDNQKKSNISNNTLNTPDQNQKPRGSTINKSPRRKKKSSVSRQSVVSGLAKQHSQSQFSQKDETPKADIPRASKTINQMNSQNNVEDTNNNNNDNDDNQNVNINLENQQGSGSGSGEGSKVNSGANLESMKSLNSQGGTGAASPRKRKRQSKFQKQASQNQI